MTEQSATAYEVKYEILGDFWLDYKGQPQFDEFIALHDFGLTIAFGLSTQVVLSTPKAELFIEETYDAFLEYLGKQDEGFESLDEIFGFESDE